MKIEFDAKKDLLNKRCHGVSLALAQEMDWDHAHCWSDLRCHYAELRMNAFVPLGSRLYFVTFVERGDRTRVLSVRLARNSERESYVRVYRD